jgi:hypothetical protein
VPELKRQILTVLSLPEERRLEIGKAEKDFVVKSFSLDKWTDEIFTIYKSFNRSYPQGSST